MEAHLKSKRYRKRLARLRDQFCLVFIQVKLCDYTPQSHCNWCTHMYIHIYIFIYICVNICKCIFTHEYIKIFINNVYFFELYLLIIKISNENMIKEYKFFCFIFINNIVFLILLCINERNVTHVKFTLLINIHNNRYYLYMYTVYVWQSLNVNVSKDLRLT